MKLIDNAEELLRDDLEQVIKKESRISIAAASFSIYAYAELKNCLEQIRELRFIFTSPTFTTDKIKKEKREFYIPKLNREKSLYGTEYEIRLRNKLTQRAIAKECAEWIKSKVRFKSNITKDSMHGFINIENFNENFTYSPVSGFTTVDIGCAKGNDIYTIVNRLDKPHSEKYLKIFNEIWNDAEKLQNVTEEIIDSISAVYKENSPEFIYFVTLYNIFNEFLEDISEDVLPNEATGFKNSLIWNKLYDFQKEAVLVIINKLENYNGCILADSVGLGKTFTALGVIKYYENRNKSALVLCPKKISDNWNTFKLNLLNNPVADDRMRYDVLYHTDLSRNRGKSNGIPLDRLNWSNYDLLVIDESHNFRNGGLTYDDGKENRYLRLLNKVIRKGIKTKVLMLSATPVNNRFTDLKTQIALAYEGDEAKINEKLNTKSGINYIFKRAQQAFNYWSALDISERTTEKLLSILDFDFFELLDSVTIARSRKHIEKYYNIDKIGRFPERNKPISIRCGLTDLPGAPDFNDIYDQLSELNLGIYRPMDYIFPSKIAKYEEIYGSHVNKDIFLKQADREKGILVLMRINLLKRLESSVYAFRLTLQRIKKQIDITISELENPRQNVEVQQADENDFDMDDQNTELFTVGKKIKIDIKDIDYMTLLYDLKQDSKVLHYLLESIEAIDAKNDKKLLTLIELIEYKVSHPINPDNRKILLFSAFSDTVEYLYNNISPLLKHNNNINTAMVTGSPNCKTTIKKLPNDFNTILTCFSPISKDKYLIMPDLKEEIDLLIGTDCISEGQNLQDCDYLINYDIHWNPVRIIQRFGRIDRIGSKNSVIQLVNFWPDLSLDEYINLKARVETRMKISVMTSTGDDNPIDDEKGDLEYRKKQLERLQNEVVDIEEMSSGISIMDLGLNEFRLDLLSYIKDNPDIQKTPLGLHAVTNTSSEIPPGVIFILKNRNAKHIENRLHPFYIVYVDKQHKIISDHTEPKRTLDILRLLSKNKKSPLSSLCKNFNRQTKEGKDMNIYSSLLKTAIDSIINIKTRNDIESLFTTGGTSALKSSIHGLDDFELICFMVIEEC